MIRRRVVCPCSVLSDVRTDDERRADGWRLVPASVEPPRRPDTDVFVWVCCACARNRIELLAAS